MEYRDLEVQLFKYTDGWNMNEGSFPIESKSDLENAEAILSKRYSKVDKHHLDMQRKEVDGTDYKIEFSEPYLEEERKRRELTFLPELDPEIANDGPIGSGLGQGGLAEAMNESSVFRMFLEDFNDDTTTDEEQSPDVIEDVHDEVIIDELPELEEVGDDEFGLMDLINEDVTLAKTNAKKFAKFLKETISDFEDGIEIEHYRDHDEILILGYNSEGNEAECLIKFMEDGSVVFKVDEDGEVLPEETFKSFNDFVRWVNKNGARYFFDASENASDYYDTDADDYGKFRSKLDALSDLDEDLELGRSNANKFAKFLEETSAEFGDGAEVDIHNDYSSITIIGYAEDGRETEFVPKFMNDGSVNVVIYYDNERSEEYFDSYNSFIRWVNRDGGNILFDAADMASDYYDTEDANYGKFKSKMDALSDLDLEESIEKHNELNPDLFENENLRPEVKEKIEEITDKFKDNLLEDDIQLEIKDILLVGSNASFNYTDNSDIDVHIVADTSIYEDKADLAAKVYEAYKRLFNNKYDPTIRGHEVEIYVDPNENHAKSNGIYSLNSGWVKEPENNDIPEVNQEEVDAVVKPYEERADQASTLEEIDKLIDAIYVVRQQGILEDGEYSLGNLTFKEFRNKGYLQRLKDMKIELENKEMSIEESLNESITDDKFKQKFLAYCDPRVVDDLGLVVDEESKEEYNVLMAGDIRELKNVQIVFDPEFDKSFVGYIDDERVIDTEMISTPEYAFRMEFDKISRSYLDELLEYWDDLAWTREDILDDVDESLNEAADNDYRASALARYLDCSVEDLVEEGDDTYGFGDEEYYVLSEDEAYEKAKNEIIALADDLGVEAFSRDFIKNCLSDPECINMDDINAIIDQEIEYFSTEEDLPDMVANLENASDEDKIDYVEGIYGDIPSDFLNLDRIADKVIEYDGVANTLAYYDGNEIDLGNDLYAYRTN